MYRRKLLLFLLAGLLLCLLRFFSHVNALRHPKVGSAQVDLHKYRVHLNRKIDTECFEQGKRQSHDGARMVSQDASTQNGARLVAQPEISAQAGLKESGEIPRSSELPSPFWRPQLGHRDIWRDPSCSHSKRLASLSPSGSFHSPAASRPQASFASVRKSMRRALEPACAVISRINSAESTLGPRDASRTRPLFSFRAILDPSQ